MWYNVRRIHTFGHQRPPAIFLTFRGVSLYLKRIQRLLRCPKIEFRLWKNETPALLRLFNPFVFFARFLQRFGDRLNGGSQRLGIVVVVCVKFRDPLLLSLCYFRQTSMLITSSSTRGGHRTTMNLVPGSRTSKYVQELVIKYNLSDFEQSMRQMMNSLLSCHDQGCFLFI